MRALMLALQTFVMCSLVAPIASLSVLPSPSACLLDRVKRAMETTNSMQSNFAVALDACEQWDQVMRKSSRSSSPPGGLPENVLAICYALQASCLVRIGRDDRALQAYDNCLGLCRYLTKESFREVVLGKALALQRSMLYVEARDTFLMCREVERACVGAATCCLRLGDKNQAVSILKNFRALKEMECGCEVQGMLGSLLYVRGESSNGDVSALLRSGANVSPLYRWMAAVTATLSTKSLSRLTPFDNLELAAVNLSPFDDFYLVHLDDKVLLHDLLTSSASVSARRYWPQGVVLPRQSIHLLTLSTASDQSSGEWILKQRAGYGSHGNRILSADEVLELAPTITDDCLLQRMVYPPLLIQDRKFTLRLYVVLVAEKVYLAANGLVKLASMPFVQSSGASAVDERMHMTNSGREDDMTQYDFEFLEREIERQGRSYVSMWSNLREAVSIIMSAYVDSAVASQPQSTFRSKLMRLGIPKILGFDFMVNASAIPQLLEVNRFPGLEARGDGDREVKAEIVQGAWAIAARRMGVDQKELGLFEEMKAREDLSILFEEIVL